mmetsp:Transcript_23069/g.63141  ORF Transcript_23069/g.63141 Transcript_23069/m.63141 type:complete len:238 (+) Transcript_23069:1201-1914(+)
MGFGRQEARAALLSCDKDVSRAATRILARRELEEAAAAARQAEVEQRRQVDDLVGRCEDGKKVSLPRLAQLEEMGYDRPVAAEALRRCCNDLNGTLGLLAEEAEILALTVYQRSSRRAAHRKNAESLVAMGFERRAAYDALAAAGGDINVATSRLAAVPLNGPDTERVAPMNMVVADLEAEAEAMEAAADAEAASAAVNSGLKDALIAAHEDYEAPRLEFEEAAIGLYMAAINAALC